MIKKALKNEFEAHGYTVRPLTQFWSAAGDMGNGQWFEYTHKGYIYSFYVSGERQTEDQVSKVLEQVLMSRGVDICKVNVYDEDPDTGDFYDNN